MEGFKESANKAELIVIRNCNDSCPLFYNGRSTHRNFCYLKSAPEPKIIYQINFNDTCKYGLDKTEGWFERTPMSVDSLMTDASRSIIFLARRKKGKFYYNVPDADKLDLEVALRINNSVEDLIVNGVDIKLISQK